MLVQFLIENSAEIFGGDIASLFQRPDKNSRNSEGSLGKLVAFYLQEIVKIFLIGELSMQNSLFLLHPCQRKVLKKQLVLIFFSLSLPAMAKKQGERRQLNSHNLNAPLNVGLSLWLMFNLFQSFQTKWLNRKRLTFLLTVLWMQASGESLDCQARNIYFVPSLGLVPGEK